MKQNHKTNSGGNMKHYKNRIIFLFIVILFLSKAMLFAQVESKGLIFNEVYLDKSQPTKSWIEIYNPTESALTLEAVRYSHIKTTNVLPDSIQCKGGILLNPKEYLILVAGKNNIQLLTNIKCVLLPVIANFDAGGFMALTTKSLGRLGIDAFKYGNQDKTAGFKNYKDKPTVNFSINGKSYSRELVIANGITTISNFYETEPTMGSPNK